MNGNALVDWLSHPWGPPQKVLVEALPQGAAAIGLTREDLQTDVELKLRLAGMHIATETTDLRTGNPYLYVEVNLTDNASAANIDVQLCQNVVLDRDLKAWIPGATTWHSGSITAHGTARDIRDAVKDHVDRFLNAWLTANPKSPAR